MSASLHDLIGRIIDPQPVSLQNVASRAVPVAGATLSELIGRTMGPPSVRGREDTPHAPVPQRVADTVEFPAGGILVPA
jgi:hypothetical protein